MATSGAWITLARSVLSIAGAAMLFAVLGTPARAIEIECIEASKYKYLYQLFGNDRRRFAEYMQVNERNLPNGEVCRAVVIYGRIEMASASKKAGEPVDADKLLTAIGNGGGWLATLYLASGGGNIATGLQLAELTRMFWLKTVSPNSKAFTYRPDFIPSVIEASAGAPAASPAGGSGARPDLGAYRRVAQAIERTTLNTGRGRCASACTYTHVAGIDRRGTIHVHRGRPGRSKKGDEGSMSEVVERLQKSEATIIALYRKMDTSEAFVETFRATPDATVTAVHAARTPRYIGDSLRRKCKAEPGEVEEQEEKLAASISNAPPNSPERAKLATLQTRRAAVEQCAAAEHERERLAQFVKYCGNGCDRARVLREVSDRVAALRPAKREKSRR